MVILENKKETKMYKEFYTLQTKSSAYGLYEVGASNKLSNLISRLTPDHIIIQERPDYKIISYEDIYGKETV